MFPYDIEEEEVDEEQDQEEQSIPVEYGIDFETGQLTGKKVYGIEALKVWIWNALVTDRYRYEISSEICGSHHEPGQQGSIYQEITDIKGDP